MEPPAGLWYQHPSRRWHGVEAFFRQNDGVLRSTTWCMSLP